MACLSAMAAWSLERDDAVVCGHLADFLLIGSVMSGGARRKGGAVDLLFLGQQPVRLFPNQHRPQIMHRQKQGICHLFKLRIGGSALHPMGRCVEVVDSAVDVRRYRDTRSVPAARPSTPRSLPCRARSIPARHGP